MNNRLPRIADLDAASAGWGFFLCARKEVRTGRSGDYLAIVLQDVSGEIRAKVFQEVDALKEEFGAGEFVKIQAKGNAFNSQLELIVDKIRRVMPARDAAEGFREEECIPCAPRPVGCDRLCREPRRERDARRSRPARAPRPGAAVARRRRERVARPGAPRRGRRLVRPREGP